MSTQPPRREEAPPPTLGLVDPSSTGQEQEQTLVHTNPPSGDPTQVSSDKTLTEGPSIVPPGSVRAQRMPGICTFPECRTRSARSRAAT